MAELPVLLASCLSGDAAVRRSAEEALEVSVGSAPGVMLSLASVAATSSEVGGVGETGVRQMAAVVLKRAVKVRWLADGEEAGWPY